MASSSTKGIKGSNSKASSTATTPLSPDADVFSGVQIPYIKIKDNAKHLPTYTAALTRPPDEALPAEDLDTVQLELETLLSNAALRYRILKAEYDSLDKDERRRTKHNINSDHKQPHSPASASTSTGKRKREESGINRKLKHTSSSTMKNIKHSKHSPVGIHTDDSMDMPTISSHGHGHHREHLQKASLPKNDTPNKFWLSVEPYCMPLTNEDLRLLDDLIERYSGPLVPPIPDLGPHYSGVWATEDLKEVQQASNPNPQSKGLKQQNNAAGDLLKKGESIEKCVIGPLTQRLVSALMEEQLIQNPSELAAAAAAETSNSSSENTQSSTHHFRSLSMLRNCIDIEKRVKKELIDQGVLDIEDFSNENEDEVLSEINRVIAELTAISEHNEKALRRLSKAAQEEMKRLSIKRKLDAVDQEILETYKRVMQNKSKRKSLTSEEEEEIFRLTAEQIKLSEELERVQESCTLFD